MDLDASRDRSDNRRARTSASILDAARELFASGDPRRVTIQQLAKASHVAVGSIYVHYGSKDGLYLRVLEDALDVSAQYTLTREWAASPMQRIFNVGDAYVRFGIEQPKSFRIIAHRVSLPAQRPEIAEAQERIERRITRELDLIKTDIAAAMQAGEMMELPVDHVMTYLWASWAGVIAMTLREDQFAVPHDEVRLILAGAAEILKRGIRPDPGAPPRA